MGPAPFLSSNRLVGNLKSPVIPIFWQRPMDEPDITLTSLSLTHVQFDRNDKLAYALAYITLAPLAILVFYASVIVSRRELAVIFALAGQLLNEGLNAILKETLQIARPSGMLSLYLSRARVCVLHCFLF